MRSKLRFAAAAECVRAPMEMKSGPADAISRIFARVTPPDTSTSARPLIMSSASRIIARPILSNMMMSALPASAALTSSSVLVSTSIRNPTGARSLVRRHAPATSPPARAIWLSLIKTPSSKPNRWFCPPPTRHRPLFECAQTGGCFPSIENPYRSPFDRFAKLRRQCGNSGESLKKIQHDSLALENRAAIAFDCQNTLAGGDALPVVELGKYLRPASTSAKTARLTRRPASTRV